MKTNSLELNFHYSMRLNVTNDITLNISIMMSCFKREVIEDFCFGQMNYGNKISTQRHNVKYKSIRVCL